MQIASNGAAYVPTDRVTQSGAPVWRSREAGTGGEEIVADLGSGQAVRAIELWLQPGASAFPRELLIAVSTDGQQWDNVWRGRSSVQAFAAALERPREMRMFWDLGVRSARFIRIRQLASVRKPWSIAELRVLPPSQ